MDFLSILTGNALLELAGVLLFAFLLDLPVPEIAKGAFGLERDSRKVYLNFLGYVLIQNFRKKSIILLLGLLVAVSKGLGKMRMFALFLVMLTLLTITESFTEVAILNTMG